MAFYGYHRVSTKEQHEDRGVLELEEFCKEKGITLSGGVFCDKQTGKNSTGQSISLSATASSPGIHSSSLRWTGWDAIVQKYSRNCASLRIEGYMLLSWRFPPHSRISLGWRTTWPG